MYKGETFFIGWKRKHTNGAALWRPHPPSAPPAMSYVQLHARGTRGVCILCVTAAGGGKRAEPQKYEHAHTRLPVAHFLFCQLLAQRDTFRASKFSGFQRQETPE